jgi:arabinogalactan oligomer/maltooligosaccharide transport system permease protein
MTSTKDGEKKPGELTSQRPLTYIEYMSLSDSEKMKYKTRNILMNIWHGFLGIFIGIGKFFANIGKSLASAFGELRYAFKNGDLWTRFSFVFLGTSHIARGQIFKGICILALEAIFIFYMVATGGLAIYNLMTLGHTSIHYYCGAADGVTIASGYENYVFTDQGTAATFCNNFLADGYTTPPGQIATRFGDNSSLILLFGILAVLLVFLFARFWYSTVKDSIKIQQMKESHQYINRAIDDFKDLLDRKFYLTLLFLPILGVCAFTILPLIDMIMMAFTNYNQIHQYPASMFTWVGFSNFVNLFGGTGGKSQFSYTFFNILGWTLVWAFFATFSNYFIGMLLAMLINKKGIRLKKFWRGVFALSIAVPQFVSLMTWNKFLSSSGLIQTIWQAAGWMSSTDKVMILDYAWSARLAVILINIWVGVPYTILTTTGILMNIPADLYESAQIDGAKPARIYFKITLPYILFVTGPYLITQFVGNINNFNVIYFLTNGNPTSIDYMNAGQTDLLVTWLYKLTVNNSDYANASVIGIMIFVISAFFSLIAYRNSSAMKNEEDFA